MKILETEEAYNNFLEEAGDKLVVIDFYADWCGPCKMIAPKIEEMAKEYTDVLFAKVNVDENEDVAMKLDIKAMPTFIFMKKGQKVFEVTGANPALIKQSIEEHK